MEPDFSGYATKAGLKCSDGRTITPQAFQHMDGMQVPLVWQHGHHSPDNVLGHAVLRVVEDGVRADGFFNDTPPGQHAKKLVQHKDINSLSIFANNLVEKAKSILHGVIREVSLVLAGANPGAKIDFVRIAHADGEFETLADEAVIYSGETLFHDEADEGDDSLEHKTMQDVYDTLDEEQRNLLHFMVDEALKRSAAHSATGGDNEPKTGEPAGDDKNEGNLEHKEGTDGEMTRVFDQTKPKADDRHVVSHDDMKGIVADAIRRGSLKEAVQEYAVQHGIENIEVLFPDARTLADRPEFNKRQTEWVAGVINGTRHSPFSRVKSIVADLTQDEARAKGYIKGEYKKEEWFAVTKRVTTPTTVYKKQKLDRDDIIDITDFDVVAWLKMEMRMMLEEELARAILIGDGRDPEDPDKIKDPTNSAEGAGIRSIANEHELYATQVYVNLGDANSSYMEVVDELLRARRYYKGTGLPTLYTTELVLSELLLLRDEANSNRTLFDSVQALATKLRVREIVTVEPMEDETDIVAIMVNLADYNVGADRGGEINTFDDFDIDYNQYKYLIETRVSGALVKIKSAIVMRRTATANVLATPEKPTFNSTTGVVTIPTVTGVVYKNADTNATLSAGAQSALAAGESLDVSAVPDSGYYFRTSDADWTFKRPAV